MKTKLLVGLTALGLATAFVPQAQAGAFHLDLRIPLPPLPPLPVFVLPAPVRCAPEIVFTAPVPVCQPPVFVERPCYAPRPPVVVYGPACEGPRYYTHHSHGWSHR
ncbi:MAG: hypothetical protein HY301_14125 [Verrucomicrobia bacterium]|nr:hypothetical protein [Verrucomicrobiota bacterium]